MTRSLSAPCFLLAASLAGGTAAFGQTVLQVSVAANGTSSNVLSGGSVTLTANSIGLAVPASVTVRYTGTGSAVITSLSSSGGPGLVLAGASALPATLSPNSTTSFQIQYLPSTGSSISGQVSIGFTENERPSLFTFTVNGTAPDFGFTFLVLPNGTPGNLTPGSLIAFPATNLGSSSSGVLNILNRGSGSGSLQSINLTGADYQITGPTGAANVPAGQQLSFNVVFTPHAAGSSSGTLTVGLNNSGSVTFFLSGLGTTADFAASYALADGNSHSLSDGVVVSFPTVDVSTTTTATITILNQGAGAGTVTGISVTGTGFLLANSPALPLTVGAGQNLHFGIVFAPTQAGKVVGTYNINFGGRSISGALVGATSTPNLVVSYVLTDGIVHTLFNGAAIDFPPVDINATTPATITIVNQGAGAGTVTGISVAGGGFQLSGVPQLPATIAAAQSLRFSIVFAPSKAGAFTGALRLDLPGNSLSATLAASTALSNFSLSYVDVDTNNTVPLTNNSTLPFPNTVAGATFSIALVALNTGAGTGTINSITLSGPATVFQLLNVPSLPLSVAPSQQLRFGVRFSPQQQQNSSDTLRVDFNGQTTLINLHAQGTQAQFSYGFAKGTVTTLFAPGGTVAVADTAVGQTSSVGVSINNSGTSDGQISIISITGQGFSLTELPAVPFTLHPNGSQQFTLNFAPTQPGGVSGRLTVGNDTFTVTGAGIGPRLIYAYTTAVSTVPVTDSGLVIFSPLAVGSTGTLTFSVQNTGTGAATVSSIDLTGPATAYSLSHLPTLPISLDSSATITFEVGFVPNAIGSLTATLSVNNSSFTLSGNGTQPAALPSYQFQGSTTNQQPAQQLPFGLMLDSPYPLPLQGTLTLAFVSTVVSDDPAIQFASGGRTVNFTIPANSTQALFNGNATSLSLQTGTTAGNIVITPAFAMQSGFDLTPSAPKTLTLTIQPSAPQLISANVTSQTLTSFMVVLNGYSTTHSIRQLDILITARPGQTFPVTHLTVDLSSASSAWFQSAASAGFGGSFVVAFTFNLSNGSTTSDLVHLLQSLSTTITNDVGASSALSVLIP